MPTRPKTHNPFKGLPGAPKRIRKPREGQTVVGAALTKRKKKFLSRFPLCAACLKEGKYTEATDLDHIVSLQRGGPDTWDNLQSLCHPCHVRKTTHDRSSAPSKPAEPDAAKGFNLVIA